MRPTASTAAARDREPADLERELIRIEACPRGAPARRGTFREDLYDRLSVIHIEVPPLRERLDDAPLLAEFFLAGFAARAARRISGFAPDAIAIPAGRSPTATAERPLVRPWRGRGRRAPNADGGGDGNTEHDIIMTGATTVNLRAERQGGSDGRVYQVHFTVTDPSGNSTQATCPVLVPHDERGAPPETVASHLGCAPAERGQDSQVTPP